jgi:hypothetical protein
LRLLHFYHAYAAGAWRESVTEHLAALHEAEFPWPLVLGLVGTPEMRDAVWGLVDHSFPVIDVIAADEGFEQLTLDAILRYAQQADGAVMYAHTKGSASLVWWQAQWRQWMTRALVGGWREALAALESGEYDVAGPHWISQELFPDREVANPCFAGNFWMATCEYLRKLEPCEPTNRYEAEIWVGRANPRPFDLLPGWPPHQEPL